MAQVWMYVVGASSDPDSVNCAVPWQVDENLIFFGPCMKGRGGIREPLRKKFLGPDCTHKTATDDLFIVGVNGSNKQKIRKVIWVGRLSEVMTFAEAYERFKGDDRFKKLREHKCSPLHVKPVPVEDARELVGYEHASELHNEEDKGSVPNWVKDLVSKWPNPHVFLDGQKLKRRHGTTPWQAFDRDCCMLLENRFFALGQGIEFDEEAIQILQDRQPKKAIDSYAIFGYMRNDAVNGLHGNVLNMSDNLANRLIAWLEDRSHSVVKHQRSEGDGPAKTCCT